MQAIKIAIVDDIEKDIVSLSNLLLQIPKIEIVFTAESGYDFLVKLKDPKYPKPNVVFMDYMMNHIDGLQCTDFLDTFNFDIKIVAVSSYSHKTAIDGMLGCGANAYLNKGILNKYFTDKDYAKHELQQALHCVTTNTLYVDPFLQAENKINITKEEIDTLKHTRAEQRDILKKYQLSQKETTVAYYTGYGLSQKQIAYLMAETVDNIERLRKKVKTKIGNLATATDLTNFMQRNCVLPVAKMFA